MSTWVLNRRQTHWTISLFPLNFIIIYHLGSQQGQSNALSRGSYLASKEGDAAYN
jgi:hypothetical protein